MFQGENLVNLLIMLNNKDTRTTSTDIPVVSLQLTLKTLQHINPVRGVFRTLLNIYDETFSQKLLFTIQLFSYLLFLQKAPSQVFNSDLRTPLGEFIVNFELVKLIFVQREITKSRILVTITNKNSLYWWLKQHWDWL